MKIRFPLALLVIINLIFLPLRFIQASSFFDVSDDVLFAPYIENLYEQHFVEGYSLNGEFTGQFGPNDPIQRKEYAKITVINRLAEQYGVSRDWAEVGEQKVESDLYELLLPYFDCNEGACDKIGGTLYQDVAATDKKCDEGIDGSCEPWFGRYVYYATDKGFIEGFDENGAKYFRPDDNLVRIHSFKMLLVDDFNVPPMEDARFRRLSDMADSNNSFTPKCLKGSEAYILANNRNIDGEIDTKTRRILEYSLLADRLDFFGNECQVFSQYGAKTARQRADFLQRYLTRQEAARYFTLSTTYSAVKIAPEEDETVNTETENQNSEAIFPYHTEEALQQAVDQAKQMIQEAEVLVEASKDENDIPTLTLEEALKQVEAPDLGPVLPAKPKAEEVVVNKNELIAEDGLIVDKEGNIYTEDLDVYNEAFYGIDIPEQPILEGNESYTTQAPLTLCSEAGKCTTADPGTDIKFTRINTDEDGTLWQEVSYNGNTYRMLCEEIRTNLCREAMRERYLEEVNWWKKKKIEEREGCFISPLQISLINRYLNVDYKEAVNSIWNSSHHNSLKFYMQLGLDTAIKKANLLERRIDSKNIDCEDFWFHFSALASGHSAAELRNVAPDKLGGVDWHRLFNQ
jgi:hypothetical protein